jgi:hypothetical protein
MRSFKLLEPWSFTLLRQLIGDLEIKWNNLWSFSCKLTDFSPYSQRSYHHLYHFLWGVTLFLAFPDFSFLSWFSGLAFRTLGPGIVDLLSSHPLGLLPISVFRESPELEPFPVWLYGVFHSFWLCFSPVLPDSQHPMTTLYKPVPSPPAPQSPWAQGNNSIPMLGLISNFPPLSFLTLVTNLIYVLIKILHS